MKFLRPNKKMKVEMRVVLTEVEEGRCTAGAGKRSDTPSKEKNGTQQLRN